MDHGTLETDFDQMRRGSNWQPPEGRALIDCATDMPVSIYLIHLHVVQNVLIFGISFEWLK